MMLRRVMVVLALALGACGASSASVEPVAQSSPEPVEPEPVVEPEPQAPDPASSAAEAPGENEAPRASSAEPPDEPPTPEHPVVLPLTGWIGAERHEDDLGDVDELRWDESTSEEIVYDGLPYGVTDMFALHARFALADSDSPARLDVSVIACDDRSPTRPRVAQRTRSFGHRLDWRDVSENMRTWGPRCRELEAEYAADGSVMLERCPPTTPRAYVATLCSHALCTTFTLYDDVRPSESALLAAVGRGRFRWVFEDHPVERCP